MDTDWPFHTTSKELRLASTGRTKTIVLSEYITVSSSCGNRLRLSYNSVSSGGGATQEAPFQTRNRFKSFKKC